MRNKWILSSVVALAMSTAPAWSAITIAVINADPAGVGFNDPSPRAPVGGNPGTTLGAQRLNVYTTAAATWAAAVNAIAVMPNVQIRIKGQWTALPCNATSAVLGSAGPEWVFNNFPGAGFANTWYHATLAKRQNGTDLTAALTPNDDINSNFNVNLGNPGCLTGIPFYLGLDNMPPPSTIDFLVVLLHEVAHGMGFSTTTNGSTGAFFNSFPHVFDRSLLDPVTNLTWHLLTNAQRAASGISNDLLWNGIQSTTDANLVLEPGRQARVTAPAAAIGQYLGLQNTFGNQLVSSVSGELMPIVDALNPSGPGCTAFNAFNTAAVNLKIAIIDRGGCLPSNKALNAQNAGATGVIIANFTAGLPSLPGNSGSGGSVTIPVMMVSQADGNTLKGLLANRSRTRSGVFLTLERTLSYRHGEDSLGRLTMFAPDPFQGGSSISHWNNIYRPPLLMQPAINPGLGSVLGPPSDLTISLLRDTGW